MPLNSEASVVNTTKFEFAKASGGSKTISILDAKASPTSTQIDNLQGAYVDNATIGGGVTLKNAKVDATSRITFTTA